MHAILLLVLAQAAASAGGLREEHAGIMAHIDSVEKRLGAFGELKPAERKQAISETMELFEHIRRHANEEEGPDGVYTKADKLVGGSQPFTATMRYEHRIIVRSMKGASAEKSPRRFANKTLMLLGLIRAHLEEEEQVVLPVLENPDPQRSAR